MIDNLKVGDRVRNIYHPEEIGTVIRVWDGKTVNGEFNPYRIMVLLDGDKTASNFKPEHLEKIK